MTKPMQRVPHEQIIELHKQGFSNRKIASILGIGKSSVGYHLLHFVGNSKRPPLTADQEQIILGSLLGDSAICRRDRSHYEDYVVHLGHGENQLSYLRFKHKVLQSKQTILRRDRKPGSGYPNGKPYYRFTFYHAEQLPHIYSLCTSNNKKTVTRAWLDKLSPLGLAVWFQDDGYAKMGGSRKKDGSHSQPLALIATNSFTDSELQIIIDYFNSVWRISFFRTRVGISKHGQQIIARNRSATRLVEIIAPYLVLPKYCDTKPADFGNYWL